MATNVKVVKRRGEPNEKLIRRFTRKCKKERILEVYKEKTGHYVKPSVVKRLKKQQAIREHKKNMKKEQEKFSR